MKKLLANSRRRKGAVTVEMAVTVPILFLFVFAALEFCGMNNMRHTVDNAAYEAARRGIVPGARTPDVVTEATNIMSFVGARNVNVTVDPAAFDDSTPELTVTVTVPAAGNGWLTPMFFRNTDMLVGQCRMAREEY